MTDDTTSTQPHSHPHHGATVVLSVPRAHVKDVKLALEKHQLFDRHHGISPEENTAPSRMRVSTTLPCVHTIDGWEIGPETTQRLKNLHLHAISTDITPAPWLAPSPPAPPSHNPLRNALREALEALPPPTLRSLNSPIETLVATFPDSYSIYPPLLLLPSASLPPLWTTLLASHPAALGPVWTHIATTLQCTHVALNAPIPAAHAPRTAHAHTDASNALRSPANLVPLHGSFGPSPTPQTLAAPTPHDFNTALWVRATQNGITQTWAPAYTMFSRGNVKEKARVLRLASSSSSSVAVHEEPGFTAVDMYAGIGYFAFSYRRAGARRVLCWELNPWSVEGLRRGAALNGWTCRVFESAVDFEAAANLNSPADVERWDADFYVFAASNEGADAVLRGLAGCGPPVRHVNLGLLPVSRGSWAGAVGAVDERLGGWVHAHENVGVEEMEERRGEVERAFQRLVDARHAGGHGRIVRVEHVEKVKMYAPGVVHAVFDVYIPGTT